VLGVGQWEERKSSGGILVSAKKGQGDGRGGEEYKYRR